MKRICLLFYLVWGLWLCDMPVVLGQTVLQGQVLDKATGLPLAYANVGLPGRGIGTVTQTEGFFRITLPAGFFDQDTLRITFLGYKPFAMTVGAWRSLYPQSGTVRLEEKAKTLKEVVVRKRKAKESYLGNRFEGSAIVGGFDSNELGCEVGVRIKVKRKPASIEEFGFHVVENIYDTIRFRINLYRLNAEGEPDTPLTEQPIFATCMVRYGRVVVDLRPYQLSVEEDFFISLEWIQDLGQKGGQGLNFSGGMTGAKTFSRGTSHAPWVKVPVFVIGFYVKVFH